MEKEFVPYKQALELKELGFNEPCLAHLIGFGDGTKENGKYKINQQQVFYPNDYISSDDKAEELGLYPFGMCGVPLYQQAFRWFREKYDLQCWPEVTGSNRYSCRYDGNDETGKRWVGYLKDYNGQSVLYSKYEEAELACLIKLIKIVKE
jgi:hypothetical protein